MFSWDAIWMSLPWENASLSYVVWCGLESRLVYLPHSSRFCLFNCMPAFNDEDNLKPGQRIFRFHKGWQILAFQKVTETIFISCLLGWHKYAWHVLKCQNSIKFLINIYWQQNANWWPNIFWNRQIIFIMRSLQHPHMAWTFSSCSHSFDSILHNIQEYSA